MEYMLYDHDSSVAVWCKSKEKNSHGQSVSTMNFLAPQPSFIAQTLFYDIFRKPLRTKWMECIITCAKIQFQRANFYFVQHTLYYQQSTLHIHMTHEYDANIVYEKTKLHRTFQSNCNAIPFHSAKTNLTRYIMFVVLVIWFICATETIPSENPKFYRLFTSKLPAIRFDVTWIACKLFKRRRHPRNLNWAFLVFLTILCVSQVALAVYI